MLPLPSPIWELFMKYLVSLFLVVTPLLTSCYVQDDYYDEELYYNPPPRVEVIPHNSRYYHRHEGYRQEPRSGRVYHGHRNAPEVVSPRRPQVQANVQKNVHGHSGSSASVPRSSRPSSHVEAESNVHRHAPVQANVHGHGDSKDTLNETKMSQIQVPAKKSQHGHN